MKCIDYRIVCSLFVGVLIFCAGCAQVVCFNNPPPLTPTTLSVGSERTAVLGELGQPAGSDQRETKMTETYVYKDGGAANLWGWKTVRIVGYTVFDLATLWFDQVLWMPLEGYVFAGEKYSVTVEYKRQNDGPWLIKSEPVTIRIK